MMEAHNGNDKKRKLDAVNGAPSSVGTATAANVTLPSYPHQVSTGTMPLEAQLQSIRQLLCEKKVERARECFRLLPLVNSDEEKAREYLHAILHQYYLAGMYDVMVILKYLKRMPYTWMLNGCAIIHEADESIRHSIRSISHFATFPLAYFLHDLLLHANATAASDAVAPHEMDFHVRKRAETYWNEWFCPTIRAIVMGKEVVIQSHLFNEMFYVPASEWAFDDNRKNVFCWAGEWTPDGDKEKWRFIPVNDRKDRFYLQSVAYDEYLYASNYAKYRTQDGTYQSRVFTWTPEDEDDDDDDDGSASEEKGRVRDDKTPGVSGEWQLVPVDLEHRDVFALYNPYQSEFLFATRDFYEPDDDSEEEQEATGEPASGEAEDSNGMKSTTRRLVRTAKHRPTDVGWLEERKWRVLPVNTSMQTAAMEFGMEAFLMKHYALAVDHFTRALEELPDHTNYVKCFVLRMVSNLRMRQVDTLQSDFEHLQVLGGQHAAQAHGLLPLYEECAKVLQGQVVKASNTKGEGGADTEFAQAAQWKALKALCQCPLSKQIMQDPVMTPSGSSYERTPLEQHLDQHGNVDPITRQPLTKSMLVPNHTLKKICKQVQESQ